MQAAPIYKRIIAYLIDISIVNIIITAPFRSIIKSLIPQTDNIMEMYASLLSVSSTKIIIITLFSGIFAILYWSILEFKIQQTLGSLILNISVKPLTKKYKVSQSLIRNLTKISTLLLILDSLFVFTNPKKQRFTEKLSQTMTI